MGKGDGCPCGGGVGGEFESICMYWSRFTDSANIAEYHKCPTFMFVSFGLCWWALFVIMAFLGYLLNT